MAILRQVCKSFKRILPTAHPNPLLDEMTAIHHRETNLRFGDLQIKLSHKCKSLKVIYNGHELRKYQLYITMEHVFCAAIHQGNFRLADYLSRTTDILSYDLQNINISGISQVVCVEEIEFQKKIVAKLCQQHINLFERIIAEIAQVPNAIHLMEQFQVTPAHYNSLHDFAVFAEKKKFVLELCNLWQFDCRLVFSPHYLDTESQ